MAKKVKEDFTTDFFPALEELEKTSKISKEVMLEALESGLVSAYKKDCSSPQRRKGNNQGVCTPPYR